MEKLARLTTFLPNLKKALWISGVVVACITALYFVSGMFFIVTPDVFLGVMLRLSVPILLLVMFYCGQLFFAAFITAAYIFVFLMQFIVAHDAANRIYESVSERSFYDAYSFACEPVLLSTCIGVRLRQADYQQFISQAQRNSCQFLNGKRSADAQFQHLVISKEQLLNCNNHQN
ncbi:hypothetical protein HQ393_09520 [Chitinibacter bivalviorum]|uniref:Uncharacterized protein n=1 Tax=Chitinibacter bivalviorum TaxID=2739434 RepID=A0A7H9BIK4_9NEIS|nr:hypothetical protein [Chitinibacter bivalviorum]QLG88467.1 hypothetical protein HQ393_09520 [Chitinibacter bivalviorum]